MKDTAKAIAFPLALLFIFISFFFLWDAFKLPQQEDLVSLAKIYFERYGFLTLFVSAIFEGIFLVGLYYPGSFVIFLSVLLAGRDVAQVAEAVAVATAGLYAGYLFDYMLGKYGWYRAFLFLGLGEYIERARKRLENHGVAAIVLSFWHPNFAVLASTAAGTLHLPFSKFIFFSLPAAFFWHTLWATLIYIVGEKILSFMGIRFAIVAVSAWVLFIVIKFMVKSLRQTDQELHQCGACGLYYEDRGWAEKCEAWCREHKSCNLEIIAHAKDK